MKRRYRPTIEELSLAPRRTLRFCLAGLVAILASALWWAAAPSAARAQDPVPALKDDPTKPWHVAADKLSYDDQQHQYVAEGNVAISKEDKRLTADRVRFDKDTMKASAEGHAVLTVGADTLSGSRMDIDLEKETGTVYDGYIFLREKHFHVRGQTIEKIGKDTYALQHASITACDDDWPAWQITGQRMRVTLEGYGVVNHAAVWAKGLPVAYTPYFVFPAKRQRQSGFLIPRASISDSKGFEFEQPYFWAISDQADATFYADVLTKRGLKAGVEARYMIDAQSRGTFMADYLHDNEIDDGTGDSEVGIGGDATKRDNQERYWFRGTHQQTLPYGFFGRLDLDVVSDQDYLREFKNGYTGYAASEDFFSDYFSRELDDYDQSIRLNRLNLQRAWSHASLNASMNYYDNVIYRQENYIDEEDNDFDMTLSRLPMVQFNAAKQRILGSPVYYKLDSEYDYFYSRDNSTGNRIDVYPRAFVPFRVLNYLSLEPSAGVRGTAWQVDTWKEGSEAGDDTQTRGLYDLRLDMSSELFGVYAADMGAVNGIKHTIRPQVIYRYIPDVDQEDQPFFDSIDFIPEKNSITYSLIQTFTSRAKLAGAKPENDASIYNYRQFMRFELQQTYDLVKEQDNDPEPFSDITARLDLVPGEFISLEADAGWDPYNSHFDSHNIATRLFDYRGDELFVEHRYAIDSRESIYSSALVRLPWGFAPYVEYERDLREDEDVTKGFGLIYEAQCWSLDVSYVDELEDQRYSFWVNLYGLGGLGQRSAFGPGAATSLDRRYVPPGIETPPQATSLIRRPVTRAEQMAAAAGAPAVAASATQTTSSLLATPSASSGVPLVGAATATPKKSAATGPTSPADSQPSAAAAASAATIAKGGSTVATSAPTAAAGSPPPPTATSAVKPTASPQPAASVPAPVIAGTPIGKLHFKAGLMELTNRTPYGNKAHSDTFRHAFTTTMSEHCPELKLTGPSPNRAGDFLMAPPRIAGNRIDGLRLAQEARKAGYNTCIGASLVDVSTQQEASGFWWFADTKYFVRVALLAEVFDMVTGTKLLDETFSHRVMIDESDYEKIVAEKRIDDGLIQTALTQTAAQMGKRVCEVLGKVRWQGFITAVRGEQVTISAGSDTGLAIGNVFGVFDSSAVKGSEGQQYFLPGGRIGSVRITAVASDSSEAVVVSGKGIAAGQTLQPLH